MSVNGSNHNGMIVGSILKEHGVRYAFGINGAHVWPYERGFYELGINRVHVRHEQTAVYAADAYARITRRPSICYATSGPGMTNCLTGLAQAWWAGSPVIALFGQHDRNLNGTGSLQEAYAEEMCKTITKWVVLNEDPSLVPYYLRKAINDCVQYPPGPIAIANTLNALLIHPRKSQYSKGISQQDQGTKATKAPVTLINEAVEALLSSRKPVIVAGNGAYWAKAGSELRGLVELVSCPFNLKRLARGLIEENHALCVSSGFRNRFWKESDLLILVGHRLDYLESFGAKPPYPKARRIIITESESEVPPHERGDLYLSGNPKTILTQMIELVGTIKSPHCKKRNDWVTWLQQCRKQYQQWIVSNTKEFSSYKPVHGFVLGAEVADFLDGDATIVLDSFTGSAHLTDHIMARVPGQVLDTGPWGGIGHGIGMGIGAQLARPGKQVLVMMGDGGMGIGGMDIETAVRWKLPVVYVVYNNSDWISGLQDIFFKDQVQDWKMIPDIRYDLMFEILGCHAEFVTESSQIRPALERAFNSGKTAIVNVIVDPKVIHHLIGTNYMRGVLKRLVDREKIMPEMWDLLNKGLTKDVVDRSRELGYPFLGAKESL